MKRIVTRVSTLPALASLLSFLLIAWAMWAALDVRRTMPEIRAQAEAVHVLLGRIDRMDAALTAVVRLAASTGEERWVTRHGELERELDESVDSLRKVMVALQPERANSEEDTPSGQPVGRMAAMEREALSLVRSGDPEGALAIIDGESYNRAKAGYQRRKAALLSDVRGAVEAAERQTDARLMSVVVASGASFLLLLIVWGVVVGARSAREQKRLEARLRRSRERLRSIVDVAPVAIVRVNRDRRIQFWSRAAERIFGWTADEVLGRHYSLVSADRMDESEALFERAFRDEPLNGVEIRRPRKDGTDVDLRVWNSAVRDDAGQVVGIVGVIVDVTEQRALEARLRQAQKLEAVGRLAGGIAHDFNNVMTTVLGHAELLLDRLPEGDLNREDLEEICRSAERATRLTSQLLAFSRQQVMRPAVLDLAGVLAGTDAMLRRLVGDHIRFETRVAPELGRVEADATQVEQVLLNLAVNARDAMPDGGTLTIRLENADLDAPIAGAPDEIPAGRYVRLAMEDTGAGMDDETLARAFEPFFTTKDVGAGTGLGLATVFGIVKQSGGHCRVDSRVGHGTRVEVLLPRVEKPLPEPQQPAGAAGAGSTGSADSGGAAAGSGAGSAGSASDAGGRETVLLVEDDHAVRGLVRRVLQRRGYRVLEAATPGEALLAVLPGHEGGLDLLVTDVVMPEMDGYELAARIATLHPAIPTIFMSGYTEDEVVRRGVVTGSNVFLQKPFAPADLTTLVRQVLDRAAVSP